MKPHIPYAPSGLQGFTLIELSIVLMIIGLIVGGVLVGRDLIHAALVRAQVAQIEKYDAATNAFRIKYGGLPGDLRSAADFGFIARGAFAGEGDGNGLIEGVYANAPGQNGPGWQTTGETAVFWRDLGQANLIDGSFTLATETTPIGATINDAATINQYFPVAKIDPALKIYVFSDNGINYFGMAHCDALLAPMGAFYSDITALAVGDAFAIDSKIDDGYPQTGATQAKYVNGDYIPYVTWPSANFPPFTPGASDTSATPNMPYTCYDNAGIAGAVQRYSVATNANSLNCAMSFKFE